MNLLNKMKYFLIFSGLLTFLSVGALWFFGLNTSVDFTGGIVANYDVTNQDSQALLASIPAVYAQNKLELENIKAQGNSIVVQTKSTDATLIQKVNEQLGLPLNSVEVVGSALGAEFAKKSALGVFLTVVGILLYISYAFRTVPKPYSGFRFAVSTIVALVHDILVLLGVFSVLGKFFFVEIDILFVTALLTLLGFSVNDTIVVFDRVRENLLHDKKSTKFFDLVNKAINETIRRSLISSSTVILVLLVMLFFGGSTIRLFMLALVVGMLVGTYSSIFIACPVLVLWETKRSAKK